MTQNSRKAIRKLSNDPTTSNPPCLVSANQVTHQLLVNGSGTMSSKPRLLYYLNNRRRLPNGIPFQRRRVQERSGNTEEQQSRW